jgi:hypothetical protein
MAAPEWGITMTHANAYGLQAGECPSGHEEYFPSEAERDCGVDPYTGSGTTFSRESGFNTYTITVSNQAAQTSGLTTGDTLSCSPGSWEEGPTLSYSWLRNGVPIAGAEAGEYTLVTADEGKLIQCQVAATDPSGTAVAVTGPVAVTPSQGTGLPVLEVGSKVQVPGESSTIPVGETLACEPGKWSNSPTFAYRWLRNGTPITGAAHASYTVAASDVGTSVQCEVLATNAGGVVASENEYFTYIGAEEPSPYPPYFSLRPTIPSPPPENQSIGPVSVADRLPAGFLIQGARETAQEEVSGAGWACEVGSGGTAFTCARSDALPEEEAFPPIYVRVSVEESAANGLTNVAAVTGGGATTKVVEDATDVKPAVPFGVAGLSTGVTERLGNPFTQAGGHPTSASATLVFNRTVSDRELKNPLTGKDEPTLDVAGGTPKEIQTELPPGFLGNPQNSPRCTTPQAEHNPKACPRDTAVGFATLDAGPEPGSLEAGRGDAFPPTLRSTVTGERVGTLIDTATSAAVAALAAEMDVDLGRADVIGVNLTCTVERDPGVLRARVLRLEPKTGLRDKLTRHGQALAEVEVQIDADSQPRGVVVLTIEIGSEPA